MGEWSGVAAGDTKPDTGYLQAEMGGACMPNGDTDQRLISLGAHFNLTTQNTHTLSLSRVRTCMIKNLEHFSTDHT